MSMDIILFTIQKISLGHNTPSGLCHLEVDLGIHLGVQAVFGNYLLSTCINHHFRDVDLYQALHKRYDPDKTRISEPVVLSKPLDKTPIRRSYGLEC